MPGRAHASGRMTRSFVEAAHYRAAHRSTGQLRSGPTENMRPQSVGPERQVSCASPCQTRLNDKRDRIWPTLRSFRWAIAPDETNEKDLVDAPLSPRPRLSGC